MAMSDDHGALHDSYVPLLCPVFFCFFWESKYIHSAVIVHTKDLVYYALVNNYNYNGGRK